MEKGKLKKEKIHDLKENKDLEKSKLEADLAEKKKQIGTLNAKIANSKEEMTDVKSDINVINTIDSDAKLFCRDCPFHCHGMNTTCGDQLNHTMRFFRARLPDHAEDDHKKVLIKMCPTCKGNSP